MSKRKTCVSCGRKLGSVAWIPSGGDEHCDGCAGAALELLAALEEIAEQASYTGFGDPADRMHYAQQIARAAIAKARGEA